MNLERTLEIYHLILNEYEKLGKDSILVIDYTGFARDYSLCRLLEWYVSYENGQSKYNFDNRYFNYYKLIEMLNNGNTDYIDSHISAKT